MSSTKISPPVADDRRLHDELAGLGDGHEEALDLRVGHGHRPALLDLAPEQRHHAAGGVQHIAEADRDVSGCSEPAR